jgi:protein-tyrosine phosphatase
MDLSGHISQPLTDRLVRHADLILTMTRGHHAGVVAQWPSAAGRTLLLSPEGRDVADPIGGPLEMYERCAEQIDAALAVRARELNLDDLQH